MLQVNFHVLKSENSASFGKIPRKMYVAKSAFSKVVDVRPATLLKVNSIACICFVGNFQYDFS